MLKSTVRRVWDEVQGSHDGVGVRKVVNIWYLLVCLGEDLWCIVSIASEVGWILRREWNERRRVQGL
jgi:hypothetical protein